MSDKFKFPTSSEIISEYFKRNVLFPLSKFLFLCLKGVRVFLTKGPRFFWKRLMREFLSNIPQYHLFVKKTRLTQQTSREMEREQAKFSVRPMFRIFVTSQNLCDERLKGSIKSVLNQVYPNFELILCFKNSISKANREKINSYLKMDPRIKSLSDLSFNRGDVSSEIEFIGFLRYGDELAVNALFEIAKMVQEKEYDLIYTDEDKIDNFGTRHEPYFKPDWSPDLLLSYNYISNFAVYSKKIVDELQIGKEFWEANRYYDFVLQFTEKTDRIKRLPKVLYSSRNSPESCLFSTDFEFDRIELDKTALRRALKRRGIKGDVYDGIPCLGTYRVKRKLLSKPLVTIIIPFKDKARILKQCLESIFKKSTYSNYEILLVDNNSTTYETKKYISQIKLDPRIIYYRYEDKFNFSSINNFAVTHARGEILVILNNDTEVITHSWIEAMLEHAQREEVGCVGAKLYYPDYTIQHAGVFVGYWGTAGHQFARFRRRDHGYFNFASVIRNTSSVTAACMMLRKSVFKEIGGFDEKNLAVAYNDIDFCLKVLGKGYFIIYTPYAELFHHESLTRGVKVNPKEEKFFKERYKSFMIEGDPYYNPNLSLERADFSLRLGDTMPEFYS